MAKIDILEKPIARIQETCAIMGIAEQFERALPDWKRSWKVRSPMARRARRA